MGDATRRYSHACEQVIKVAKMTVGEEDAFLQTLEMVEFLKNQAMTRGGPDEGTIKEIRQQLQTCLNWSTNLEIQISQCMEAVRSAPSRPQPSGEASGGANGSKKEPKVANPKPAKLGHLNRMPEPGDQVAAKIASHDLWVLTSVISYNGVTEVVEVQDEDDVGKRRYHLPRSDVVLCPRKKEALGKHYPKQGLVFALYPGTTSFYPAQVVDNSIRVEGEHRCRVYFDDDEDDGGQLVAREVPCRFLTHVPALFGKGT